MLCIMQCFRSVVVVDTDLCSGFYGFGLKLEYGSGSGSDSLVTMPEI